MLGRGGFTLYQYYQRLAPLHGPPPMVPAAIPPQLNGGVDAMIVPPRRPPSPAAGQPQPPVVTATTSAATTGLPSGPHAAAASGESTAPGPAANGSGDNNNRPRPGSTNGGMARMVAGASSTHPQPPSGAPPTPAHVIQPPTKSHEHAEPRNVEATHLIYHFSRKLQKTQSATQPFLVHCVGATVCQFATCSCWPVLCLINVQAGLQCCLVSF